MIHIRTLIFFLVIAILSTIGVQSFAKAPPQPESKQTLFTDKQVFGLKYDAFGLIDPSSDVIPLQHLPTDNYGFVDWSKAISDSIISPRDFAAQEQEHTVLFSKDIIIKSKMDFMPDVLFPHDAHNFWLSCSNCHSALFKMKAGTTPISMTGIWKGEFCGRCHDKVAFPLRNCFRCHSVQKDRPSDQVKKNDSVKP